MEALVKCVAVTLSYEGNEDAFQPFLPFGLAVGTAETRSLMNRQAVLLHILSPMRAHLCVDVFTLWWFQ